MRDCVSAHPFSSTSFAALTILDPLPEASRGILTRRQRHPRRGPPLHRQGDNPTGRPLDWNPRPRQHRCGDLCERSHRDRGPYVRREWRGRSRGCGRPYSLLTWKSKATPNRNGGSVNMFGDQCVYGGILDRQHLQLRRRFHLDLQLRILMLNQYGSLSSGGGRFRSDGIYVINGDLASWKKPLAPIASRLRIWVHMTLSLTGGVTRTMQTFRITAVRAWVRAAFPSRTSIASSKEHPRTPNTTTRITTILNSLPKCRERRSSFLPRPTI